jgi:homocysteine S-methyltransferase
VSPALTYVGLTWAADTSSGQVEPWGVIAVGMGRRVLVLDGGVSERLAELVAQSCGSGLHPLLWSSALLHPEGIPGAPADVIQTVHREFLEAGSDIITTVSYQGTLPGFRAAGLATTDAEAGALLRRAVTEATAALALHAGRRTCTAASTRSVERSSSSSSRRHPALPYAETTGPSSAVSIGPYGAFLHDGSEYRGDYTASDADLRAHHQSTVDALLGGVNDPDAVGTILAFETVPVLREATVLAEMMRDCYPSTPFWISFQCGPNAQTAAGEELSDCCAELVRICGPFTAVAAARARDSAPSAATLLGVGVNCCAPDAALQAVRAIKAALPSSLEVLVAPNSGEVFCAKDKTWAFAAEEPGDSGPGTKPIAEWAEQYAGAGATIIGGCCRVTPADIAAIRKRLATVTSAE